MKYKKVLNLVKLGGLDVEYEGTQNSPWHVSIYNKIRLKTQILLTAQDQILQFPVAWAPPNSPGSSPDSLPLSSSPSSLHAIL